VLPTCWFLVGMNVSTYEIVLQGTYTRETLPAELHFLLGVVQLPGFRSLDFTNDYVYWSIACCA
jgi:hypothetical protein